MNHPSKPTRRSGLTLIELLVVLTILIALGGIVVSSLPGLLGKTQTATAAANVSEIDASIRRNLISANGFIGNRFDALLTSSGGAGGEVPAYVGGSEIFQATSLSASDIAALRAVGIVEVIPADGSTNDATFASHTAQPSALSNDTRVCSISPNFADELMDRIWNLTPSSNDRYLVFGLGSRCSLVGGSEQALFAEAPVHFSDDATSGPKNMYSRYLIVVELKSESDSSSRARYVGVAIPDADGLKGISQELQDAYSTDSNN